MSDDIVERLKSPEVFIDHGGMFSPVAHVAADEITRLRAELAAERDRNGIITQAAQEVTNALRTENEKLREALKPFADEFSLYKTDFPDHFYISDLGFTFGQLRAAAAALEGMTEPASPWRDIESAPNDQIILVYDKSASTKIVAAFLSEGGWLYAEGFEADPEGPIPTQWMPLPEPPSND